MKRVIAKAWHEASQLGEATFYGVPVLVPDDFPAKAGAVVKIDQKRNLDVAVGGDVGTRMALEIAKQWAIDFVGERRTASSITAREVHGILLVLGINKTEFAKLLKVDKGTVTKYIAGSMKPPAPVTQLMLIYLAIELAKPGTAKALLSGEQSLIAGLKLNVPSPKFVIKKAV